MYTQNAKRLSVFTLFLSPLLLFGMYTLTVHADTETSNTCDVTKNSFCVAPRLTIATDPISSATVPKIATPAWLAPVAPATTRTVTYSVETRGTITSDLDEFKTIANQTYNDSRGWSRLGVSFREVPTGGDFTLVLSEASQMTTFSSTGCDTTVSCTVGRYAIINQTRWLNGSDSWNAAGGNLLDYRRMVINHETGHWLGHGHLTCGGAGQPAPVMQQQTISMQGCEPNPWPLAQEMYAPTLGIRS